MGLFWKKKNSVLQMKKYGTGHWMVSNMDLCYVELYNVHHIPGPTWC